jgi:uncharacterized damage-inducible protein DinB
MRTRRSALIDLNIRWLRQALSLLRRIDNASYSKTPAGFAPHRAGAHLRHVIDFYCSFLDGVSASRIDYEARRRNETIERSRRAAAGAIRSIIQRLQALADEDRTVLVRMEDADGLDVRDCFMESSISRELQVLSSHSIHHFALIAMTLRMHRLEMDPDFGMAPSTLKHLASREAA